MSLLREATMEQGAAKFGCYGPQGSGKTSLTVQLAIGLSKTYHSGAPIAFFDTEKGSDAAKVLFDTEGIKMLRIKSRAFTDLLQVVKEAEQAGCCALIVDSMTHVWNELMDAFCEKKKIARIQFEHWRELKATWRQWTDAMLNSAMHMLIAGRAGNVYEYQESDVIGKDGKPKKELITTGTKMKAEGEFGYEPDVLVELWIEREEGAKRGSHVIHKAIVLKDRYWALNGKEFTWKDCTTYKKGAWTAVYKCFEPYFSSLNVGGAHQAIDATRRSHEMFDSNGDSQYSKNQRLRVQALEDWDATMTLLFPGQSAADKRARMVIGEAITGVRSRSRMEDFAHDQMQQCVGILMALEARIKTDHPSNESELMACLEMAKEDFRNGAAKDTTLLETMLKKSVEAEQAKKQQQEEAVPF